MALLVAATLAATLLGCGKSPDESIRKQPKGDSPRSEGGLSPFPLTNTKSSQSPTKVAVPVSSIEEPAWLEAALSDPDPRVRLQAIEVWANNPGENINPFTYALVDPDEQIRARAQELFEEELARR